MKLKRIIRVTSFFLVLSLLLESSFMGTVKGINAKAEDSGDASIVSSETSENAGSEVSSESSEENLQTSQSGIDNSTDVVDGDTSLQASEEEATTEMIPTLNMKYKERRAVWFSFFDLDYSKKTKAYFTKQISESFDNVKKMGMNTVVCHVRPFGDAMYPSKYFPWSKIASKKQGKNPGYDPMAIMITEAHKRNLRFEAWINPYRVTLPSHNIKKLSKKNKARIWYSKKSTRRNVLLYNGQFYYNPSKPEVRNLIAKGIKEIVENYPVEAIHFDDYFYPSFTTWNYKTAFDAPEYKAYVKKQKKAGKKVKSIQSYRRNQVNKLVRKVYKTVKDVDPNVEFGISPAGNLDNLKSKYSYYVDISRWLKEDGYIDYVCPQIYWGFDNGFASYDKFLKRWLKEAKGSKVKFYVGLGMYRTVSQDSYEWRTHKNIMKRQIAYARKRNVQGLYFFTYSSFTDKRCEKEKKKLVKELKKKKDH